MDVRKLTYPDGDFQAVVDKGTLDCLFFLSDTEVLTAMSEISRVLKKRGVYICVSCAPPEARKKFFDRPADLRLELEKVIELKKPLASDEPHYVYIVRKGGKLLT
jgi:ubiquinone/menaquinone biosynthesis C-methylase UbiE